MRLHRAAAATALGVLLASFAGHLASPPRARAAGATAVPVASGSFESFPQADGAASPGTPRGWMGWARLLNPGSGYAAGLAGNGTVGTMAGPTVLTLSRGDGGGVTWNGGTRVQPGLTYRLTVAVGNRPSGTFGGARVSILAGGRAVATRQVTTPPAVRSFGDVTVSWTAGQEDAGLRLGVHLDTAAGAPAVAYGDFDNVRLVASGTAQAVQRLVVSSPVAGQVLQRNGSGEATVPVRLVAPSGWTTKVRLVARAASTRGRTTAWTTVPTSGSLSVAHVVTGWYDLQVQSTRSGQTTQTATVAKVGVGEVFVVAGQSNSANFGQTRTTAKDARVTAPLRGLVGWQDGDDPQPNAAGTEGSPWPTFGDLVASRHGVPVGIISVGHPGTRVSQWQPGGPLYAKLLTVVGEIGPGGLRAVLWHQGEADASHCTTAAAYASRMGTVITTLRKDTGRAKLPWMTATASNQAGNKASCETAVRKGQALVRTHLPVVLVGPDTDSYVTRGLTYDGTHFTATGLAAHGKAWADAINARKVLPTN